MNNIPSESNPQLPALLVEYFSGYRNEVNGDLNKFFTETTLHKESDEGERLIHSALHGGKTDYKKRFRSTHSFIHH